MKVQALPPAPRAAGRCCDAGTKTSVVAGHSRTAMSPLVELVALLLVVGTMHMLEQSRAESSAALQCADPSSRHSCCCGVCVLSEHPQG